MFKTGKSGSTAKENFDKDTELKFKKKKKNKKKTDKTRQSGHNQCVPTTWHKHKPGKVRTIDQKWSAEIAC